MDPLIAAVDDVLERWGNIVEADRTTEGYLQEIVDVLKDKLATPEAGKRQKQARHFLLPLLVWAEVSRRQIISHKTGVNAVIEFLADVPLPNGKAYGKKALKRLYKDGVAQVGKLDPWILSDTVGAIQAAEKGEIWVPRAKDQKPDTADRYKKEIEARYAQMSEAEQQAETERVFLNQLRQQIALDPPARERKIIDDCLLGIARCRGIDLTEIDAQAWVKSVISEL